jgi:hypothetical protein
MTNGRIQEPMVTSSLSPLGTSERPSSWAPLALTLPLASMLAWFISFFAQRDGPDRSTVLLALLMPLACLPQVARRWTGDDALRRQVVLMGAFILWNAACVLLHPARLAIGLGWIGSELAGLAIFLAVATAPVACERGFLVAGSTAACTLAVCGVGAVCTRSDAFGFGNINFLLCSCVPQLLALCILVGYRWWRGTRPPAIALMVLVIGLGSLVAASLLNQYIRRGPLAAAMAVAVVLIVPGCYRRFPRLVLLVAALLSVVLGVLCWHLVHQPVPSFRLDRLYIYRSALERIAETWPIGWGASGALGFQFCAGETARHWLAVGHYALQAHNELLESMLTGGVLSGLLWLTMLVGLIARIRRIDDDSERAASATLLTATMVHAMTDNSYSLTAPRLIMYASLGLIFACRCRESCGPAWPARLLAPLLPLLPSPRQLAWCGALAGALIAYHELPGAINATGCAPQAELRALRSSLVPVDVLMEFRPGFDPLLEQGKLGTCKQALDDARMRVGLVGPLVTAQQQLASARLLLVEGNPTLWAAQSDAAHVLEVGDAVSAGSAVLRTYPFSYDYYERLGKIISRHLEAVPLIPEDIYRRLRYITNHSVEPVDALPQRCTGIDQASDLYALVWWWLATGRPPGETREAILALVGSYGDVPDVAELGLVLAAHHVMDPALLHSLQGPLALGFCINSEFANQAHIIEVRSAEAVKSGHSSDFAALLAALYPVYAREFQEGRCTFVDDDPTLRNACIRAFGMAQGGRHGGFR